MSIKHYLYSYSAPVGLFLKDPNYLVRTNAPWIAVYAVLMILIWSWGYELNLWLIAPSLLLMLPDTRINLAAVGVLLVTAFATGWVGVQWWAVLLIPLGIYAGWLSGLLMHNAAHKNFKRPWVNELVGQGTSCQMLIGLPEWGVPHILYHHRHSDDLQLDPHPGTREHVLKYGLNMKPNIVKFLVRQQIDLHGADSLRMMGPIILMINFQRLLLLWLLLGPFWMMWVWVPSYLSVHAFFVAFNYYTHRPDENGKFRPVNLEDKGVVWLLNRIGFGTWYHANHHQQPGLFNPAHLKSSEV